jgi:cell division protein ZapA
LDNTAQSVTVRIYNQTYTLRVHDDRDGGGGERTQVLAALVDARMHEIAKEAMTADTLKVAILAALHLADQLDRVERRQLELFAELTERQREQHRLLDQIVREDDWLFDALRSPTEPLRGDPTAKS